MTERCRRNMAGLKTKQQTLLNKNIYLALDKHLLLKTFKSTQSKDIKIWVQTQLYTVS
jgi:hypothetical protein